jgi:hypothetical protein
MTNRDRVLEFLRSISPRDATNAEIVAHTAIKPDQQVFQITKDLYQLRIIKGSKGDGEWKFWSVKKQTASPMPPPAAPMRNTLNLSVAFEEQARRVMSQYFGVTLDRGKAAGVSKAFDLISADKQIVGDAKFYGRLVSEIDFYFIDPSDVLERLGPARQGT